MLCIIIMGALLHFGMAAATALGNARMVRIVNVLDTLYPNPPVPLNSVNDFTFLVSVVLSAQTTDGKVSVCLIR